MQSQLLYIHLSPEALSEMPHISDFLKCKILIINCLQELRVGVHLDIREDYDRC